MYEKGTQLGMYGFGGSTNILLFPGEYCDIDDDIQQLSAQGKEVYTLVGESLGSCDFPNTPSIWNGSGKGTTTGSGKDPSVNAIYPEKDDYDWEEDKGNSTKEKDEYYFLIQNIELIDIM